MTSSEAPVLTFGEGLVGYASGEGTLGTAETFTRFPGGADLNVAVGLHRLGYPVTWATVLGDDPHGDYLADVVHDLGIGAVIKRSHGLTALMFKAGGGVQDPQVLQVRNDSAFARHADDVLNDLLPLDRYRHLHLTGMALGISSKSQAAAEKLVSAAHDAGITTSFDPNLRLNLFPDQEQMQHMVNAFAARCTLVMPGLAEGRLLTGHEEPNAVADFYLGGACEEVVIKLGAAGALAKTATGESASARTVAVDPVDTVGAGDGFAAGYLAGLLSGLNLQDRLDQAARVGAMVTTRRGDLDAMPTREELDRFVPGRS